LSYTLRPNVGDTLANTRDPIRTNFSVIQSRFNENHVLLDGGAGGGKHKFLQMPEQSGAGILSTAVDEAGFYAKVGTNPAEANLFFRGENSGFEYQLTKAISTGTARFGAASATIPNGWTFLPGNVLYQWGQLTNPGTTGQILFATNNINFPNAVYIVLCTLQHSSSANEGVTVRGDGGLFPSITQFSYRTTSSSASTRLNWIAIGS